MADMVRVHKQLANVRSGPGTGYPVLVTAPEGTTFPLLATQQGWHKIRMEDGRDGWISSRVAQMIHTSSRQSETENMLKEGISHIDSKNYEGAISVLNNLISLDQNNYNAYVNRGIAYRELGRFGKSMNDFNKAIKINPKNALAYNERGYTAIVIKSYTKAIRDFTKAIAINPKFSKAYLNRGVAYTSMQKHKKAIQDTTKAIELNPQFALAYRIRADALREIGQINEAIDNYGRAAQLGDKTAQQTMLPLYADRAFKQRSEEMRRQFESESAQSRERSRLEYERSEEMRRQFEQPRELRYKMLEKEIENVKRESEELKRVNKKLERESEELKREISELKSNDISSIIKTRIESFKQGKILFNPPYIMQVGEKEVLEVRISTGDIEHFEDNLLGIGKPQIESIKVGSFMRVNLKSLKEESFKIFSKSSEEQVVMDNGFTQWIFEVTPLKSGTQHLLLIATIRIRINDKYEEKFDHPAFKKEILIKSNMLYSAKLFTEQNWQYIATTFIGSGIAGWLVKKRNHTGRGARKNRRTKK
jgi:lipoprotein NlpI